MAAVFDNIGGASIQRSWRMLGHGGTLVCSTGWPGRMDTRVPMVALFIPVLAGLAVRNYLPNGRRASFYSVWGGHRRQAWHDHVRADPGVARSAHAGGVGSQPGARAGAREHAHGSGKGRPGAQAGGVARRPTTAEAGGVMDQAGARNQAGAQNRSGVTAAKSLSGPTVWTRS